MIQASISFNFKKANNNSHGEEVFLFVVPVDNIHAVAAILSYTDLKSWKQHPKGNEEANYLNSTTKHFSYWKALYYEATD